jgi:ABC-type Co2+ transport system permease subunit
MRPRRLKTLPPWFISYAGFSQILVFNAAIIIEGMENSAKVDLSVVGVWIALFRTAKIHCLVHPLRKANSNLPIPCQA